MKMRHSTEGVNRLTCEGVREYNVVMADIDRC